MPNGRTQTGLEVFLLYCALLAMVGPAMFWTARLGLRVPPSRVQGYVGYFWDASGTRLSHVAIPLEGDEDLFLDGAEVSDVVGAGMQIEKRRGEFAVRIDGAPARWPLHPSHVVLALGGLFALAVLSWSVARAPLAGTRLRSIAWLGAPGRLAVLLAPGLATVVVGLGVAFARGELDRVVAAATLGVAALGAAAWSRGGWRRLHERLVLARAHRWRAPISWPRATRGRWRACAAPSAAWATTSSSWPSTAVGSSRRSCRPARGWGWVGCLTRRSPSVTGSS
jgi:hypothetical protein